MSLKRFLRYNGRHSIYWREGDGPPKLDTNSKSYGGKKRVVNIDEPLWLFLLRRRLFALAGRQLCPSRNQGDRPNPDEWHWGPDGNRTCSYCGSLHRDDFMKLCRLAVADERYSIEMSDKAYKAYVTQPGVHNASEGAIKFYMHHAPKEPFIEDQDTFRRALRVSNERFDARMGIKS